MRNQGSHPDSVEIRRQRLKAQALNGKNFWPLSITIHPTAACNHGCAWCWFSHSADCADISKIIDAIELFLANGLEEVVVSGGGEPLLHPQIELLFEYLELQNDITRRLYTNGSLLARYPQVACAFDYVRVSIDAGGADDYARVHRESPLMYEKIFKELKAISNRSQNTEVGVSMVVNADTASTMSTLLEDCAKFDIKFVVAKPLLEKNFSKYPIGFHPVNPPEGVKLMLHESRARNIKPNTLPLEISAFSILIDCDDCIYPCCHLKGDQWRIARATRADILKSFGSDRHIRILTSYAREVHDCPAYNLWS